MHFHTRDTASVSSKELFLGGMSFSMAELYPPTGPPCGWFYLLDREIGEYENVPAITDILDL